MEIISHTTSLAYEKAVDAMNAILTGELSAVETYEQALAKFGLDAPSDLRHSLQSHQMRVQKLTARIYELGGVPVESSGMWGMFARLVEGGATLFGRKSALAALEEGEDHGLATYRERVEDLDPESRRLAESEWLPEQLKTHDNARNLYHTCA